MTARAMAVAWSVRDLARRGAFAVAAACAVFAASPAEAQFFERFFEPRLSGRDIDSAVRDRGVSPAARPRLFGDVYVVHGYNRRGERVRVLVDAFEGRVVETTVLLEPGVRLRDYDRRGPRRARLREEFDGRPPALVPGRRLEAMRPGDDGLDGPRVGPAPGRKPETRKGKPKRPVTAARQPATETPKPAAAVPVLPGEEPAAATNPAEDKTAARPPASEPKVDSPAEKPPETATRPPASEPSPNVDKPAEKPPVTAARPAPEPTKPDPVKPEPAKPETAKPDAVEKPPVTAARPPEPEPKPAAPAKPAAAEKPASSTTAATSSTPSGGAQVKIVPPAPLDEAKSTAKAPPKMPPVQPMD